MSKNVEKFPYQERIKVGFGYILSGKMTEGACNQDLQNQERGV